jgi:hypothetical protein
MRFIRGSETIEQGKVMWWPFTSKETTPSEWAVLLYAFCVLLVLAGSAGLVVSIFASAEKHELAVALAYHSLWSLGAGLIIGFGVWLVRRLLD